MRKLYAARWGHKIYFHASDMVCRNNKNVKNVFPSHTLYITFGWQTDWKKQHKIHIVDILYSNSCTSIKKYCIYYLKKNHLLSLDYKILSVKKCQSQHKMNIIYCPYYHPHRVQTVSKLGKLRLYQDLPNSLVKICKNKHKNDLLETLNKHIKNTYHQ